MATPMVEPMLRVPQRKPVASHSSIAATSNNSHQDASQRFAPQPAHGTMTPMIGNPQTRRTLSNATSSTTSSYQNSIRRSSSGRSNGLSPSSYVALLRKQKATVWCDRSQAEDPRIRVQQRMAKERAEKEVAAGPILYLKSTVPHANSGSFTGGVARKIRHHGGKPVQYTGGNLAGAGVPLRLSATEVDDDPEDEKRNSRQEESMNNLNEWERDPAWGFAGVAPAEHHRRTGSGRSSLGSQRRAQGFPTRFSTASSTPTSGHSRSPSELNLHNLAEETPQPSSSQLQRNAGSGYFQHHKDESGDLQQQRQGSSGGDSGNSSSRENSFGGMAPLPEKNEAAAAYRKSTNTEDLARRGSVDERTMTMGRSVRLFVANPDLSD